MPRPMAGLPTDAPRAEVAVRLPVSGDPSATQVAKTFGTSVPERFREGERQAQMTPASPFSPGTPIGPYDGYDRHTRQFNFTTGYNISTRPRLHEAVSFSTLTGLVESYDVCQIVIWHRIDSIRSLDWKLLPADHITSGTSPTQFPSASPRCGSLTASTISKPG